MQENPHLNIGCNTPHALSSIKQALEGLQNSPPGSRGVTEQSTLAERGEFHENSTPILRVDYSCIYNNL